MRDIKAFKFRLWHKIWKVMDYFDLKTAVIEKNSVWIKGKEYDLEGCIIMQYTGLKDNTKWNELKPEEQNKWLKKYKKEKWQGKEIYEGDILKRTLTTKNKKKNGYKLRFVEWHTSKNYCGYWNIGKTNYKIIGNIYLT